MLSALINKYKNYYLIAGLTLWLFRPTGNDFYIIFVLLYFLSIFINKTTLIKDTPINLKSIKIIIYISLALITTTLFMKFMSFGYHHMDLGLQHQLIINLVKNNEYFHKFHNFHGFGDHFKPTHILFMYLFYNISITSFWLIFFKCLSIVMFALLFLKINKKLAPIILLSYLLFSNHNISSIYWEYHPTNLLPALVIIIYYSILKQNWLVFWITMIFSIGLKENAAVLLVCFGVYFVFIEKRITFGVFLSSVGLLYMLLAWFVVIPFFAQGSGFVSSNINLFRDIPEKLQYIFMAYAPFLFLPFLNWRWLLFTLPALGINLIGKPEMYSGSFHYADILSALIAIASLATLTDNYERIKKYLFGYRVLVLFPIILIVLIIPESPMQKFVRFFPNDKNRAAFFELNKFLEEHPTQKLAVSTNISPMMDRAKFEIFVDDYHCDIINNAEYIVYFNHTYRNQVHLVECIKKLKSSNLWKKINKYQSIGVYEVRT
jgi:uncharacterized membrane protein